MEIASWIRTIVYVSLKVYPVRSSRKGRTMVVELAAHQYLRNEGMKPRPINRATVMAIPISTALVQVISEAGFVLTLIEVLRSVSGQVGRHYSGERRVPKSLSSLVTRKFVLGTKLSPP